MKALIVYFSNTGNTQKISERICAGIQSASFQCELFRLRKLATELALHHFDLVGIGCPTYAYKEPFLIKHFIEQHSTTLAGKHVFVFCTSAGHPGNTLTSMVENLKQKGARVIGGFNCDAAHIIPGYFVHPWFTDGHPDEVDFSDAFRFGKEMAERSARIISGVPEPLPEFRWLKEQFYTSSQATAEMHSPRSEGFRLPMTLNQDECHYPECKLCVEACPMNAIDLKSSPISFRKGCISCYFCEAVCPYGAIQFDSGALEHVAQDVLKKITKHEYIEFFETAKTRLIGNRTTLYRNLVGKVDISNLGRIRYRVFGQHPRIRLT